MNIELQRARDLLLEHLRSTPPRYKGDRGLDEYTEEYGRLRQQLIFVGMNSGLTMEAARQEVDKVKRQVIEEDRKKRIGLSEYRDKVSKEWKARR